MRRKERKKEIELIHRIKEFRGQYRTSFKEKFLEEREERHQKGEFFFKGMWVPKDKVTTIQKKLKRKGVVAFFETLVLLMSLFCFNFLLFFFLKNMLLP